MHAPCRESRQAVARGAWRICLQHTNRCYHGAGATEAQVEALACRNRQPPAPETLFAQTRALSEQARPVIMKVLLIGVGTVGEAIARISSRADWCEAMILADYDLDRARTLSDAIEDPEHFPAIQIDARSATSVTDAARAHRVDLVMNAVDPQFVMPIFTGALAADAHYMDMACSLSKPHPDRPFEVPGVKLGDEQFAMDASGRSEASSRSSAWAWIGTDRRLRPTPPSTT